MNSILDPNPFISYDSILNVLVSVYKGEPLNSLMNSLFTRWIKGVVNLVNWVVQQADQGPLNHYDKIYRE